MSRSASDVYTRFTSTSPHASAKPTPSTSSSPSFGSYQPFNSPQSQRSRPPPGPPNETPQEKVARLRAAYRLTKAQAAMSPLDRTIDMGRRVADKAHRIVAYGLIGFSAIATVFTVYALIDLIRHHRRQKRAWIDRELQRLQDARQAFVRGDATAEQLHLLQQERAGDEMVEKAKLEKARKRRESWWGRGLAAAGLGPKDGLDGGEARLQSSAEEVLPGERLLEEERWVGDNTAGKSITAAARDMVDDKPRTAEQAIEHTPATRAGSLDVLAANITEAAVKAKPASTGKTSWLDWGKGKGQQS